MKINSVTTQDLDSSGKVISFSKTVFKTKLDWFENDPSDHYQVDNVIERHQSNSNDATKFVVTISTSKGKFIKTYAAL